MSNKRVVKVACGGFHTLVLTSEEEVYAFGSGVYGECGYGEFYDTTKPKLVKMPQIDKVRDNIYEHEIYNENIHDKALNMYL